MVLVTGGGGGGGMGGSEICVQKDGDSNFSKMREEGLEPLELSWIVIKIICNI